MGTNNSNNSTKPGLADDAPTGGCLKCLLVVEPEALLRWSLVTYLGQWFDVFPAETRVAAERVLETRRIDAVVVSDELSEATVSQIEARARACNSAIRVVRTVTTARAIRPTPDDTCRIEKPFDLAHLARLLGVTVTESPGNGVGRDVR